MHRCLRTDELEAEVTELKNLLLFRRFTLGNVGSFRPQRARQLRLIAAQARRLHLRVPQPRPLPTVELLSANNRGGRA